MPRDLGLAGLGLSLWMTPFSTTAITEHLFTHISQVVGTSTRVAPASRFFRKGSKCEMEAATVAPTVPLAVHVRNRLRSIASHRPRDQPPVATYPCHINRPHFQPATTCSKFLLAACRMRTQLC